MTGPSSVFPPEQSENVYPSVGGYSPTLAARSFRGHSGCDECYAQHGKPFVEDLWQGDLGPEKVHLARQGYYASVSFVDEQIGRILDTLSKHGVLEKTFILTTADHGDMTGDHHLWGKTYGYEPSARIPMIVRWPEGLVSDSLRGAKRCVCGMPGAVPLSVRIEKNQPARMSDAKQKPFANSLQNVRLQRVGQRAEASSPRLPRQCGQRGNGRQTAPMLACHRCGE